MHTEWFHYIKFYSKLKWTVIREREDWKRLHVSFLERSILHHDRLMRNRVISICQNHTGIRQWFLRYDIKSTSKKRKRDKLNFIKIKIFCASKDTIKWKDNPQEKIIAHHTSDKGLVSKIYKECLQLSVKREIIQFVFKQAKDLNRQFFKEGIQQANNYRV